MIDTRSEPGRLVRRCGGSPDSTPAVDTSFKSPPFNLSPFKLPTPHNPQIETRDPRSSVELLKPGDMHDNQPHETLVRDNRSPVAPVGLDAVPPQVGHTVNHQAANHQAANHPVKPDSTAAWLVPGLGCRHVGMGHDLFEHFVTSDRMIAEAESLLGYDLAAVCLTGSGRKHVPPRQEAQVIYVLDCAYAAVLREQGCTPSVVAGHSLGSLAAGWICGAYDFQTGLELVTHIEELMEELVDGRGLVMGVIIGLDAATIQSHLTANSAVCPANWNSPLQHVIAGPVADVDGILAAANAQGAKQARRFGFERAIHTPYVAEVAERFRVRLDAVKWSDPRVPMAVSQAADSRHASLLRTAAQIQTFLGDFLSRPVYWQATIEAIKNIPEDDFVEVGPGNLLSSMLPFIDRAARIHTASEILEQKAA